MGNRNTEKYADGPLAVVLTAIYMPETEVSERTDTTYRIGAQRMLTHLISGNWEEGNAYPSGRNVMGEFLARALKNARRQGVLLPGEDPELEPVYRLASTYEPYFEEKTAHDWVMVGDKTRDIYGSGTDAQIPHEDAHAALEEHVGENVHLFGRPVARG